MSDNRVSEDGVTEGGALRAAESPALRAAESGALRAELLAGIRRRRDEFAAAGDRAEELRTLPAETVATLRAMGAFWLKTPAELGGTPLAPLDFCDVMEEFGYADAATALRARRAGRPPAHRRLRRTSSAPADPA